MNRKKKSKYTQRKAEKRPPITYDPKVFEESFRKRLGQTPLEWIAAKVESGSPISSIQYLFEISAAAIAQRNYCAPQSFERYYNQYLKKGKAKGSRRQMPESVERNYINFMKKEEPKTIRRRTAKAYNKLVRDRIPELIESSEKECVIEILDTDRYIEMLDKKLDEELAEYQESKSLEELADLLEVMGAVVKARGYTWEQLTSVRKKKHAERGGFDKKIFLKEFREYELSQPETTSEPEKSPSNAGKQWTKTEEGQLRAEFDSGMTISDIASKHKRSIKAISARLVKLELLPEETKW